MRMKKMAHLHSSRIEWALSSSKQKRSMHLAHSSATAKHANEKECSMLDEMGAPQPRPPVNKPLSIEFNMVDLFAIAC